MDNLKCYFLIIEKAADSQTGTRGRCLVALTRLDTWCVCLSTHIEKNNNFFVQFFLFSTHNANNYSSFNLRL